MQRAFFRRRQPSKLPSFLPQSMVSLPKWALINFGHVVLTNFGVNHYFSMSVAFYRFDFNLSTVSTSAVHAPFLLDVALYTVVFLATKNLLVLIAHANTHHVSHHWTIGFFVVGVHLWDRSRTSVKYMLMRRRIPIRLLSGSADGFCKIVAATTAKFQTPRRSMVLYNYRCVRNRTGNPMDAPFLHGFLGCGKNDRMSLIQFVIYL